MGRSGTKGGKPRASGDEPAGTDPAAATRQLPVLLHRTREALAVHFRKVFVQHDLTDPQWRVLRILSQFEGSDVKTLARKSYLMRESLSRILKDLAERGLIVRRVSNTDARRFLHSLTAKGRHLLDQVAPAFNPVYKEIESRFGIQRIEELNRRLAELLEAVQLPDDEEASR
jgi:homoprotocatechuate degradation regulator HpaR